MNPMKDGGFSLVDFDKRVLARIFFSFGMIAGILPCLQIQAQASLLQPKGESCQAIFANDKTRLFLSSENAPRTKPFLENAQQMYEREKDYFQKLSRGTPLDYLTFTNHILENHRILSVGLHGDNSFLHPGSGGHQFKTALATPGHFRAQGHDDNRILYKFQQMNSREGSAVKKIAELFAKEGLTDKTDKYEPAHSLSNALTKEYDGYKLQLEGIESGMAPVVEILTRQNMFGSQTEILHLYPKDFAPYLQKMLEVYQDLAVEKRSLGTPAVLPEQQVRVLQKIALYFHYALNAHALPRMNNSLFSIQMNSLLEEFGWKGNYHGDLDVYATSLNFEDFWPVFLDWFKQLNSIPIPG